MAKKIYELNPKVLYTTTYVTGDTPLHLALSCAPFPFIRDCVNFLVSYFNRNLDRNEEDERGQEAFLLRQSVINAEEKSLVFVAAEKGKFEAVELLLQYPPLNDCTGPDGTTALHAAVLVKRPDMVELLLKFKPGLSRYRHQTTFNKPIHHAAYYNEVEIVRLLLEADVADADTVNYRGHSPFILSTYKGSREAFELFLRYSPHCYKILDNESRNALHIAAAHNHESIVEFVAKDSNLSAMVNQQDEDGNTPLHIAASEGNDKMIDLLLGSATTVQYLRNLVGLTFEDINQMRTEDKRKKKTVEMQSRLVKATENFQSGLLVMASLIITVTFTAGFTLPGGYNGSDPNQGMATLARTAAFDVFLVSNSVSMGSAILATAALILFSVVGSTRKRFNTLKMGIFAIAISITFMLVAFVAGVWAVIGSQRRWLAITTAAVVLCIPVFLTLLLVHIMFGPGNDDDDDDEENRLMKQQENPKFLVSAI